MARLPLPWLPQQPTPQPSAPRATLAYAVRTCSLTRSSSCDSIFCSFDGKDARAAERMRTQGDGACIRVIPRAVFQTVIPEYSKWRLRANSNLLEVSRAFQAGP